MFCSLSWTLCPLAKHLLQPSSMYPSVCAHSQQPSFLLHSSTSLRRLATSGLRGCKPSQWMKAMFTLSFSDSVFRLALSLFSHTWKKLLSWVTVWLPSQAELRRATMKTQFAPDNFACETLNFENHKDKYETGPSISKIQLVVLDSSAPCVQGFKIQNFSREKLTSFPCD